MNFLINNNHIKMSAIEAKKYNNYYNELQAKKREILNSKYF